MDSEFINQLILISIIWLSFAAVTGFVSKKRNKSFLYGFFIGCVFGIFGVILILLLPKKDMKKNVMHTDDRIDSRLRYYKIKEEFEEYKKKQEENKT
jgi:hypothetical protein